MSKTDLSPNTILAAIEVQRLQQAECCVAYLPCPVCHPGDGSPECGFCHGGPGVPATITETREPKDRLLPATVGCRGGVFFGMSAREQAKSLEAGHYNGGCTGCHVDYAPNERPKLPGKDLQDTLRRILATPMWRGSTVVEVPDPTQPGLLGHYLVKHPSGAVLTLRRPA